MSNRIKPNELVKILVLGRDGKQFNEHKIPGSEIATSYYEKFYDPQSKTAYALEIIDEGKKTLKLVTKEKYGQELQKHSEGEYSVYVCGSSGDAYWKHIEDLKESISPEDRAKYTENAKFRLHAMESIENGRKIIRLCYKSDFIRAADIKSAEQYEFLISNIHGKPNKTNKEPFEENNETAREHPEEKLNTYQNPGDINNDIDQGENAFVYIMSNPSLKGLIKVGMSVNVEKRRRELSSSTSIPDPFSIEYVFTVPITLVGKAEKIAHMALRGFQQKKEYFSCTPTEAIPLIKQELDKHIRFSTIDVKAIKSTIRDYTDRISTLRQEIVSTNNEYHLETEKQNNFFSQKLTKIKDELDREFKDQAKRSKGVFIIIALLICGVSLWFGKEILYVVLCPVSLIWVPLLLKYFPLFAENIKEHKDKYSAFESEVNKNKSKRLEELNKSRSRELKRINEKIDDLNKHKASHEKMLSVLNR